MELEPATRWWKEEFQGERGCVVEWFMGWLGEDTVREETRMIMESLGSHDEEVGLFQVHQEMARDKLEA